MRHVLMISTTLLVIACSCKTSPEVIRPSDATTMRTAQRKLQERAKQDPNYVHGVHGWYVMTEDQ